MLYPGLGGANDPKCRRHSPKRGRLQSGKQTILRRYPTSIKVRYCRVWWVCEEDMRAWRSPKRVAYITPGCVAYSEPWRVLGATFSCVIGVLTFYIKCMLYERVLENREGAVR